MSREKGNNGTKESEEIKMREKRTEQIAVRITPETKRILQQEAARFDWTVAKLAEKILSEWTKEAPANGGIINFFIE